jgi:hypothetical protein
MIKEALLKDLMNFYYKNKEWAKLEALWMFARYLEEYEVAEHIKIRYGSEVPLNEIKEDFERLFGEKEIKKVLGSKTDSKKDVKEVLKELLESIDWKELKDKVIKEISSLSKEAIRVACLLYKEGTIKSGWVGAAGGDVLIEKFAPAYKILYGEDLGSRGEDLSFFEKREKFEKIKKELIKAGLIVEHILETRRHFSINIIVPPYAREIWENLPSYINCPKIEVIE